MGMLQLGLIPSNQFSHDPKVNPELINPYLQFPAGMNQLTIQPLQSNYPTSGDANLQGLGVTMANYLPPAAAGAGISGVFDSWWWTHRKLIAIGTVSIVGVGIVLLATKVLK
jgi:hypothetical protein